MSHYANLVTNIVDQEALIRALCRVKLPQFADHKQWNRNHIKTYDKAENLYGYQNDKRDQTAHVIIRRANINGSSNDLGFVRGADGRFSAVISDFDRSSGFNAEWLQEVVKYYGVEKEKMACEKAGKRFEESVVAGKPTLKIFFDAPQAKAKVTGFFG
jgi:hypothetical protein